MRKMFWLFGMLATVGFLFVACSEQQDPTSPEEAVFGKKPPAACIREDQQALADEIRGLINDLFSDKKTKAAANEHINNIERKLCKDQFDEALNMAWGFLRFTDMKIPDKFTGSAEDAAVLTSKVFELAADPDSTEEPLEIPEGAFLPTGGLITFDPADATPEAPIIAATTNGEAAVVLDNPNAFPPGTGMVTIALSREDDAGVVVPGGFIPGFQAFPEGYQILSSAQPALDGGGLIIALCVVLPASDDLVIGHLHEGSVELLVPTDPDPEFLEYIDCTNATAGGVDLVAAPGWLQFARGLVEPVVRLFEPKPLNAMLFAGRGLGGRTTSLSLDAPVDPTIDVGESIQLTVGTDADWSSDNTAVATVDNIGFPGLVYGVAPGTATITAEISEVESYSILITVEGETTTSLTAAPLALMGSGVQDVVTVTPAPPTGSLVELVDVRGSGERRDTVALPDGSGAVGIPADLTFEPRSLTANFLGAPGFLPSSSTTVTQHVVQRFDDQASFETFLGGSPVLTQDFEALAVGTTISTLIQRRLDMTSPFATLEVWAGCTASQGAFGFDGTTRIAGDGRYEMVFTDESSNALAFDVGAQDPATGPALVDVNTAVGSLSLSVLNPGLETDPVYLGVAATLDLQSVVVNEGIEQDGLPGNEEVCIDNIAIANTLVLPPL